MKVLSFDPGKRHFAWALTVDGLVVEYNFLKNVLSDLTVTAYQKQKDLFKREILDLMKFCDLNPKTDYICAERFMHRPGMGMGGVSEYINLQLGMVTAWVEPVEVYLISAAKWKNYMDEKYNPTYNLPKKKREKMEMINLLDPRGKYKLTSHEADAIGIGIYCHEYDRQKPFLKKCMANIKPGG